MLYRLLCTLNYVQWTTMNSHSIEVILAWSAYAGKNGDKDEKELYRLINNVIYGKPMENLRNRSHVKIFKHQKRLFKMDIKTKLHLVQNIWL